MPLVMTLFAAGEICDGADGSPFCESMGRSSSPRGKFGKVKKAARSFIVKLQAVASMRFMVVGPQDFLVSALGG